MSTTGSSELGTVYVLDEPEAIERKLKAAVTDSGTEIRRASDKPGVSNLIEILAVARSSTPDAVEADMASARGYGALKSAVAAATIDYLAPVRERYAQLRADEEALEGIFAAGAQAARTIASGTLMDVRERMGLGKPRDH
jgi:tryptophanyl-tRNA synthetase